MSKSAGPAPDYAGEAARQEAASRVAIGQQTEANRPNQQTAWGSTSWQQDPNGQWTQTQNLSPELQTLFSQAASRYGQGMDWGQFGALPSGEDARKAATAASYGQVVTRLDPQWAQRENDLKSQLAAWGVDPTSDAYQREMGNFNRARNDAYNQANFGSQLTGVTAGESVFRQGLQGRQQRVGEALQQYNQPAQSFASLLSSSGGFNAPGFMGAGAWTPGNYLGAAGMAGNYNLQNAQQQNQFWGDIAGGASKLGAAAMGIPGLFGGGK